jgi:hypothetical protein
MFTRRKMIGAGGAVALSPVVLTRSVAAADQTGPLVVLDTPVRLYDSRTDPTPLGGAKLQTGSSVIVTAGGFGTGDFLVAAYVNVTITETEGAGFLRVTGADSSGQKPVPPTSNINWSTAGQTIANLALTTVGSENGIEVFAGGTGRTHLVVDIMGYIPFVA